MDNKTKALELAKMGLYVFPVRVEKKADNPYRTTKKPLTENGFQNATTDPVQIEKWWSQHKTAHVGVWAGKSGLHFIDLDVKRSPDGVVEIDGLENLASEFVYDLPETFKFESVSQSGGEQYVYRAPENSQCGPDSNYRKILGVDIRAGGSYSVWAGDVPKSWSEIAPAPEWSLDVKPSKEVQPYSGGLQEWFDQLTPGEPSIPVQTAMERLQHRFDEAGKDLTHHQIVEAQHNAIRLGSEGNPGVEKYLDLIKELTLTRTGSHSRSPDDYEYEFVEALESGIAKNGALTEIFANLPTYDLNLLPLGFPDRYINPVGPGDRSTFTEVLRLLLRDVSDDLEVTSVLWSLPATRDLSREWGLEFVHKRVQEARSNPEPVGENPSLEAESVDTSYVSFLTEEEKEIVRAHPTFIDRYLEVSARKGFLKEQYAVPAAWMLLSLGLGDKAWTPTLSGGLGLNLWFTVLGPSGSGKSVEFTLLEECSQVLLEDGEQSFNIGASSSPEAMSETLLRRDGKTSAIIHDEAADFYDNLTGKEWMKGLMDRMAKWYDGMVLPEQKIRLKELRGKSAKTSFGVYLSSTPSKALAHITSGMFESGFLARMLWVFDETPEDEYDEGRFMMNKPRKSKTGVNPNAYELVTELLYARKALPSHVSNLDWDDEVADWMFETNRKMDTVVRARLDDQKKYESFGRPSATRLAEIMLKCAGLLALWRGETMIRKVDILTAAFYAEEWFNTLFKIINEAGKSKFLQEAEDIQTYIRNSSGVSRAQILNRFGHLINRDSRDIDTRIEYLMDSGRIVRDEKGKYRENGRRK